MSTPMQDRDQFTSIISEKKLFSSLQPQFVQAIGPLVQGLVHSAWDIPEGKMRTDLQGMAETLADLPQKMLDVKGIKDIQSLFATFMQILNRIFALLQGNPEQASEMRDQVTKAIAPMSQFIADARKQIQSAGASGSISASIQKGFEQRLDQIDKPLQKINNVVSESPSIQPIDEAVMQSAGPKPETLRKEISKKLSDSVLPLGNALFETALSPLGLSKEAQTELSNMGKDLVNIPLDLLSGKSKLEDALDTLMKVLERLFKFLMSHSDVILKAASCILPALGPVGLAVTGALQVANAVKGAIPEGVTSSLAELMGKITGLETLLQPKGPSVENISVR